MGAPEGCSPLWKNTLCNGSSQHDQEVIQHYAWKNTNMHVHVDIA
jgi:hypothetical protein